MEGVQRPPSPREPVLGATFSLYGGEPTSDGYFRAVDELVGELLRRWPDGAALLAELRRDGRGRRRLRRIAERAAGQTPVAFVLASGAALARHLLDVDAHRRSLSVLARRGYALGATREQHLLFMVEVELANRLARPAFRTCEPRVALLPHCLRDLTRDCRARVDGADYVCAGCSPDCWVNAASRLLRRRGVRPYIWMTASLRGLLSTAGGLGHAGVLGIACLPELVHGMRRCAKLGIPAVGLPLDANRCGRWLGEPRPNTVNLDRLEALLA